MLQYIRIFVNYNDDNDFYSVGSYVSNGKDDIGQNGTIHIFSVATGQLYERFLRYNPNAFIFVVVIFALLFSS